MPKAYEQKVNKFIKEVAREAGITEKIEVSYVENGEKKTHLADKCDLVKAHGTPQRCDEYVSGRHPDHRHHENHRP